MKRTRPANPATWETVQEMARALPGAVEGTSYGTPAFHVRKKLLVRLHQSGESIVVMIDMAEREALMSLDPETCGQRAVARSGDRPQQALLAFGTVNRLTASLAEPQFQEA